MNLNLCNCFCRLSRDHLFRKTTVITESVISETTYVKCNDNGTFVVSEITDSVTFYREMIFCSYSKNEQNVNKNNYLF